MKLKVFFLLLLFTPFFSTSVLSQQFTKKELRGRYEGTISMIKVIYIHNDLKLKRNGTYKFYQDIDGNEVRHEGDWRISADTVYLKPFPEFDYPTDYFVISRDEEGNIKLGLLNKK